MTEHWIVDSVLQHVNIGILEATSLGESFAIWKIVLIEGKGALEGLLTRIYFFSVCKNSAVMSSGSLPVSPSKPPTHSVYGRRTGFYVQDPSIIHGIFNVNRLLQFVAISDLGLRWAAQSIPLSCSLSSALISLFISWHLLYGKSSNDPFKLLSNNQLILHSLDALWIH